MDQCPECYSFLVSCPCCDEFFCPSCGRNEEELEMTEEDDD
ncbi:hypothetical protein IE1_05743 [Bacillus cereus BAG3O-2]|nr:hypothetical protein IE1_05743 [Bacillus cereus BAG3O-2]